MTYMCALHQPYCYARKHVDGAVLLYIAAIFNDDFAPIATDSSARSYIHMLTDDYVPSHRRLGVNKRSFVDNWPKAIEFVNHWIS